MGAIGLLVMVMTVIVLAFLFALLAVSDLADPGQEDEEVTRRRDL